MNSNIEYILIFFKKKRKITYLQHDINWNHPLFDFKLIFSKE